jgi:hypothetical protein
VRASRDVPPHCPSGETYDRIERVLGRPRTFTAGSIWRPDPEPSSFGSRSRWSPRVPGASHLHRHGLGFAVEGVIATLLAVGVIAALMVIGIRT